MAPKKEVRNYDRPLAAFKTTPMQEVGERETLSSFLVPYSHKRRPVLALNVFASVSSVRTVSRKIWTERTTRKRSIHVRPCRMISRRDKEPVAGVFKSNIRRLLQIQGVDR